MRAGDALRSLLLAVVVVGLPPSASAATITIVNMDSAGEGFNDPTIINEADGFPAGTSLGAKRLALFQAAANVWAAKLQSGPTIRVGANFDPQFCTSNSAVLGAAGPEFTAHDFSGAPHANTDYAIALAQALAGSTFGGVTFEIGATFNSSIDNNCFGGGRWWYATDTAHPNPGNHVNLFPVVLHELGHGLGFLSFVCVNDNGAGVPAPCGSTAFGAYQTRPDAWSFLQQDHSNNLFWNAMNDAQRAASIVNDPRLVWNSTTVNAALPTFAPTSAGLNGGNLRLYAPASVEPGSSVSHWTTAAANPDLLMEPVLTSGLFNTTDITPCLFKDIGWTLTSPCFGAVANQAPTVSAPASITVIEDTAKTITGVSFADADAGSGSLTATFTIGSGSLNSPSCSGVTAGGTSTARTLAGTLASLNACMSANALIFTPVPDATSNVTLGISINDNGNTGTGGALIGNASPSPVLTLSAVNDAPTQILPGNFIATEDVPSALTGISFADIDAGAGTVLATFTLQSANGTLNANSGAGVTVGGTSTSRTLSGTISAINSFIAAGSLTYTTAPNGTASVLVAISVNDQGNTGSGGAQGTSPSQRSIDIAQINDAPTVTAPPAIAITVPGTTTLTGISGADVDVGSNSMTMTFSVPAGALTAVAGGGVAVSGSATTTLTLTGTLTNLNSFVGAGSVSYVAGAATNLSVSLNDGGATGSGGAQSGNAVVVLDASLLFRDGFE